MLEHNPTTIVYLLSFVKRSLHKLLTCRLITCVIIQIKSSISTEVSLSRPLYIEQCMVWTNRMGYVEYYGICEPTQ
jgi:hypothetical protein